MSIKINCLYNIMESSVTSQISPKVYSGEITKLYKDDIDVQSELFEINIFNSTLHIAPGKSISDENDKLVYFYVYAIKDDKVIANLGVYELLTDEQKLLYDISTFENLLLFDYYYTNPSKIKEFEITGKNNIFDYIKTHLEYIPVDKALLVYNTFARFRRDEKESIGSEQHQSIYKKVIAILSKEIKTKGLDDEKINQLKEITTNTETLKLTLAILEPFLNVQFSITDKGESVDNYRNKTPEQQFTPKQYIIVSTDQTFVSTSSTITQLEDGEPDKELEEGEIDEDESKPDAKAESTLLAESIEGELKEDKDSDEEPEAKEPEPEKPEPEVKESKPSKKQIVFKKPKDTSEPLESGEKPKFTFLGKRLPGLKSKVSESKVSEGSESKEPKESTELKKSKASKSSKTGAFGSFFLKEKAESKADSETKAETKAESKSKTKSKAESKTESKAEPQSESKVESKPESKIKVKPKLSKVTEGSESKTVSKAMVENEPTNLEAVGIFNKNYQASEPKKRPTPSKVKTSAPRRQSAKFIENDAPKSKQKSSKNTKD